MLSYYHANKTHFHKKGFALGLVLRVRVFGTLKWPIHFPLIISSILNVPKIYSTVMFRICLGFHICIHPIVLFSFLTVAVLDLLIFNSYSIVFMCFFYRVSHAQYLFIVEIITVY